MMALCIAMQASANESTCSQEQTKKAKNAADTIVVGKVYNVHPFYGRASGKLVGVQFQMHISKWLKGGHAAFGNSSNYEAIVSAPKLAEDKPIEDGELYMLTLKREQSDLIIPEFLLDACADYHKI